MSLVMNASAEVQEFKVFGNHFTLKPGQIKNFQENIAHFIAIERRGWGLVVLPEEFEDLDFRQSLEGQKLLEEKRAEGVAARIGRLKEIIYNNQVSLRRDLEMANIKADPKIYASDGEVSAYRELVKYQQKQEDAEQRKVDELKNLEKQVKGML